MGISPDLPVAEALDHVIIDHADVFDTRVTDRRTDEPKVSLSKSPAPRIRLLRPCGDLTQRRPSIRFRSPANEPPDIGVETTELLLDREHFPCIRDRGANLQSVPDDAVIRQQGPHFPRVVLRDPCGVESVERAPIVLAFSEDRQPREARLSALQAAELEELAVVVFRGPPLRVVVLEEDRIAPCPLAPSFRSD